MDADDQLTDVIAFVRTRAEAGTLIRAFTNPAVSLAASERELIEVRALHDRCELLLARIVARWLQAPVTDGTTTH